MDGEAENGFTGGLRKKKHYNTSYRGNPESMYLAQCVPLSNPCLVWFPRSVTNMYISWLDKGVSTNEDT